jgi:hypothetical protein
MNRIYGKPEETVRQVEVNPATAVLKSMSLDEKLELLRQLQRGELAEPDLRFRYSKRLRQPDSPPREGSCSVGVPGFPETSGASSLAMAPR